MTAPQANAALDAPALRALADHVLRDRAVAVLDAETLVVEEANDVLAGVTGRTAAELVGAPIASLVDLLPPTTTTGASATADLPDLASALAGARASVSTRLRLAVRRTDVGLCVLDAAVALLPAADGARARLVVVADDITRQARELADARGIAIAVDRSQAVIEFSTEGRILKVNDAFCAVTGYTALELVGQHHRVLCTPSFAASEEYAQFWVDLAAGAPVAGEFKRIAKNGREIWLQCTYNPVHDADGSVAKVVKIATDTTAAKIATIESRAKITAIERSQAVIEFGVDGKVITANRNFLDLMEHDLEDVRGKHHRMFCERELVESAAYADFWDRLALGEFQSGEYQRVTKTGRRVWLQATYNPVLDDDGRVVKIVKFASDITHAKDTNAEFSGKVAAIDRSQAVIEFDLTGTIVAANENFCAVMGYSSAELVGKHHRIFCDPAYTATEEYASFWQRLGAGEFESGEYRRVAHGGRDVWLQATYNPVLDGDGRPTKIVKIASDVTEAKLTHAQLAGKMSAVERAQAVVEFDLDGYVTSANENFLRVMGYSLREIVGQHHSTFCSKDYVRSEEYRDFWLRLGQGEYIAGSFHRVGKYDRDVHIQATYNPIMDLSGAVVKVIKYAYDITPQVLRAEAVATGTDKMSDAVRELAASIDDIARSSGVASELGRETHSNAEEGVEALRASVEAIELIAKSSSSISEIVRVMGEIANQTNLLAFNASIEAARAGEHGVGFSIVAGEVRKLAERSSAAAQQISGLIQQSEERVTQGTEVSRRAGQAFERIVNSVAKTNDAIRTISGSTRTQQETSAVVNSLIAQIADDRADA